MRQILYFRAMEAKKIFINWLFSIDWKIYRFTFDNK